MATARSQTSDADAVDLESEIAQLEQTSDSPDRPDMLSALAAQEESLSLRQHASSASNNNSSTGTAAAHACHVTKARIESGCKAACDAGKPLGSLVRHCVGLA